MTTRPADHLPKAESAAAAEARGDLVSFTARGITFSIDTAANWDYEALEAFENGRIATFLRMILGEEQHAAFRATKPKVHEVNDFVAELQKALGIEGN